MKKGKKLLVTASLVSAAVTVGVCRFLPWMNENTDVYGPPPDYYVTVTPVPEAEEEADEGADVTPVAEDADVITASNVDNKEKERE